MAEFWIVNISDRNVSLRDLGITVKAGTSINLLSKHYYFTEEQVKASAESGSIKAKSHFIKVRKVRPAPVKVNTVVIEKERHWVPPLRSAVEVVSKKYESIDIIDINDDQASNEEIKYALETMEAEVAANAPALAVDKVYKK